MAAQQDIPTGVFPLHQPRASNAPADDVRRAVGRLALSRGVTYAGGSAAYVALLSVLYERTRSATLVAAGAFAAFAVPALISPLTGLIGDRCDRKRVLVLSELLGGLCSFAMAMTVAPAALLGLRVLASIAASPMVPLTASALPGIARSPQELAWANSRLTAAGMKGLVAGSLLAAVLLATVSPSAIFVVNAATFVLSAHLIFSVREAFPGHPRQLREDSHALAAGFRFLGHDRILISVCFAYGLIFLALGVSAPAEMALSAELGAGPSGYAALMMLWALGGIVGARLARRWNRPASAGLVLAIATGGLAVGFTGLATPPFFAFALIAMSLVGISEAIWQVVLHLLIQTTAPDAVRSRAFASSEAIAQGGLAMGLVLSAPLVAQLGVASAFSAAGAGCLIAAVILLPVASWATSACSRPLAESRAPGAGSLSSQGSPPPPQLHPSEPLGAQLP